MTRAPLWLADTGQLMIGLFAEEFNESLSLIEALLGHISLNLYYTPEGGSGKEGNLEE